jgi:hypothetical protein
MEAFRRFLDVHRFSILHWAYRLFFVNLAFLMSKSWEGCILMSSVFFFFEWLEWMLDVIPRGAPRPGILQIQILRALYRRNFNGR